MSTGKQMTLWSGTTEAEKNKVFHKTKAGARARHRAQRQVVTLNQQLIVKMRRDLRPNAEIAKQLNLHHSTVANFLREYFGDKDPLDLHVIESYRNGEGAKAIARRLNISVSIPCRILKTNGIDPWKNYLNESSESYRRMGVTKLALRPCKNPDRPRMIAEDLYCFWVETGKIEDVALETGYSAASISGRFTTHIPGYKDASASRRQQSKEMEKQRKLRTSSIEFRFERQFSNHCVGLLHGYDVKVGMRFGLLETDLVIESKGFTVIIELKVTTKQKEIARALGQLIMQRKESKRPNVGLVLCVPDDVSIHDELEQLLVATDIQTCSASGLRTIVGHLLE